MDEMLKNILINERINSIYKNNLFSIKSICEYLGTWNNYSDDEKYKLQNITKRDTALNKTFRFEGEYDTRFVYGEVTKEGAEKIFERYLRFKKSISSTDVFIDIGSGCGKLLLHSAFRLPIQTFVGIEIVKERYQYSKKISESVLPVDDKKVFFINKDFQNFDLSVGKLVFCNNLCFSKELNLALSDRLQSGTHIVTSQQLDFKILKDEFLAEVSWSKKPIPFYYYIK